MDAINELHVIIEMELIRQWIVDLDIHNINPCLGEGGKGGDSGSDTRTIDFYFCETLGIHNWRCRLSPPSQLSINMDYCFISSGCVCFWRFVEFSEIYPGEFHYCPNEIMSIQRFSVHVKHDEQTNVEVFSKREFDNWYPFGTKQLHTRITRIYTHTRAHTRSLPNEASKHVGR